MTTRLLNEAVEKVTAAAQHGIKKITEHAAAAHESTCATASVSAHGAGEHVGMDMGSNIIFSLMCVLVIGQILKHIADYTKIPYTPMVCSFGFLIAISVDVNCHPIEKEWASLKPELLLMLFMPALIFESAFSADFHTFQMQLPKILLMALPMLLTATFLTALTMYYVLNYRANDDMSFTACILFGAIISATDPVAVVALLKELGISKRIGTLIEGESLLNDGTAMVVFSIATKLVMEQKETPPGVKPIEKLTLPQGIWMFIRLSMFGPLLGIAFAMAMTFWLGRIHNKPVLETNLTICTAYLCFFTAELPQVHVSGILALVCLGLYMARQGKTRISSESEHSLHAVWATIGFYAETVIFVLAGLMIGLRNQEVLLWENVGKTLILYVLLHLIRFTCLVILLPLLNLSGYPMDIRHCALMTWGALRGALAIFLALVLDANPDIPDKVKALIMFHSSAIAMLTLIINGTTTGFVIDKLGLSKETPTAKKFMYFVVQRVKQHGTKTQLDVMEDRELLGVKIDSEQLAFDCRLNDAHRRFDKYKDIQIAAEVEEIPADSISDHSVMKKTETNRSSERQTPEMEKTLKRSLRMNVRQLEKQQQASMKDAGNELTIRALQQELRQRLLMELRAAYKHHMEEGLCSPAAWFILDNSIATALDFTWDGLYDWEYLHEVNEPSWFMKCALDSCFRGVGAKQLFGQIMTGYDCIINYIDCSNEVLESLQFAEDQNKAGDEEQDKVMRELEGIKFEVQKHVRMAHEVIINEIKASFPEIIKPVNHRRAVYYVLVQQTNFVNKMLAKGEVEAKQASFVLSELDDKISKLKTSEIKIEKLHIPDYILQSHELKDMFGVDFVEKLASTYAGNEQQFGPQSIIAQKGVRGDEIYIVTRGSMIESEHNYDEEMKIEAGASKRLPKLSRYEGSICCMQNLLSNVSDSSISNVYTMNIRLSGVLAISRAVFRDQMLKDATAKEAVYKHIGTDSIFLNPEKFPIFVQHERSQVKNLIERDTNLQELEPGEKVILKNGGILLQGQLVVKTLNDKGIAVEEGMKVGNFGSKNQLSLANKLQRTRTEMDAFSQSKHSYSSNECLRGICVIPPHPTNQYCALWGKEEENVIFLESGPDVGFILNYQIQMNEEVIQKAKSAVKNLRILIIMTRKDKWKPNTVALFHGEIKKSQEAPRASAGGMQIRARRSSMFASVQQLQGLQTKANQINKKNEEGGTAKITPSVTSKDRQSVLSSKTAPMMAIEEAEDIEDNSSDKSNSSSSRSSLPSPISIPKVEKTELVEEDQLSQLANTRTFQHSQQQQSPSVHHKQKYQSGAFDTSLETGNEKTVKSRNFQGKDLQQEQDALTAQTVPTSGTPQHTQEDVPQPK